MKKIVLLVMVFITNYLGAQSVDPETFPIVNSGIGLKYVYTNTGGEGKILVDSIVGKARNGVNGQDSLGLGGQLIQSTYINLNGLPLNFQNGSLSGFGYYPFGARKQYVMLDDLNNNLATITTSKDTTVGAETLTSGNSMINLGNGNEQGFFNSYNLSANEQATYWRKYTTVDGEVRISLDKSTGVTITPFSQVGVNTYLGQNIFTILSTSNTEIFKVKTNGVINQTLPQYQDDADAGANGLTAGDTYQTSGAGASPLNVAGIVMIKQ